MYFTPQHSSIILGEVHNILQRDEPDQTKMLRLWCGLLLWRGQILANDVRRHTGDRVTLGPFKDMRLTPDVLQGAFAPYLLGTYEHELHATVEHLIAQPIQRILNIGCSFGYYAVGLAQRMPHVTVDAFDIDEEARRKCAAMAVLNQVQDRVTTKGEFHGEDFASYGDQSTLVLMDIEGSEKDLLDPVRYPALQKMPIIVELHDVYNPGLSNMIRDRFVATHTVQIIPNKPLLTDIRFDNDKGAYDDPFDRLILTHESRDGPTPWAIMWPQ